MARLEGKRAIVTGGGNGLGKVIAAQFVQHGASVVITDIDRRGGMSAAAEFGAAFLEQDVSDEARWPEVISETESRLGGLDVLVNNAGVGDLAEGNTPEDTRLEDWRRVFRVNAEGVFLGCRAAIPAMRRAGAGSIVNLSSIAALVPTPFITAYGASKAAVLQFSKSVALHCAQHGYKIRCNTIHPGQIRTPMHDALIRDTAAVAGAPENAVRADFVSRIPLGELGEPDDIALAAVYLASDESKHVTGAQFVVDGGMNLTN